MFQVFQPERIHILNRTDIFLIIKSTKHLLFVVISLNVPCDSGLWRSRDALQEGAVVLSAVNEPFFSQLQVLHFTEKHMMVYTDTFIDSHNMVHCKVSPGL